jgi:sec-independent protein translocase protein TatA
MVEIMIGGIGPSEMMLIFAVLLLLFGANKLPELARSMGTSMGEFKKAQKESEQSLRDYEKNLRSAAQVKSTEQVKEKESNIMQVASNLGISVEGKSNDELLTEINTMLKNN